MFTRNRESDTRGPNGEQPGGGREADRMLAILAEDLLREKRARRRWGILFKSLFLLYLFAVTIAWFASQDSLGRGEHVAVVEIADVIGANGLSAGEVNASLGQAFAASSSVGVILKINSPGGTPVQAARINEEILRLKQRYPNKPVYAAVSDVCTSGGYYVAVAADEIYAHPASIIGSIGALMDGFGFVGAMEKLGIERRLLTSGENKGSLDPFSPLDPAHKRRAENVLGDVHRQFIDAVKAGRGERIDDNPVLFSGLFWSGEEARELGLIDRFGSAEQIAREVLGAERMVDYTARPDFLDRFAERVGASLLDSIFRHSPRLL